MIPRAMTEALLHAPPVKVLIKPNRSEEPELEAELSSADGITPGKTTKEPNRKMNNIKSVQPMRSLSSLIFQMFWRVVSNLFIGYFLNTGCSILDTECLNTGNQASCIQYRISAD